MYKFYKIDLSLYDNLQLGINQTLYDKYIAPEIAGCIIDPSPQLVNNNYAYFTLRDFIYTDPFIETYINQLTEITEEEYTEQTL